MVKNVFQLVKEIAQDSRWFTISNFLTVLRIFLVPVIVIGIAYHWWATVFFLLLLACVTDVLDGYIARWLNEQTALGACLDPIADKILLVSSFATLSFIDSPSFSIPSWFVLLVVIREVIILGGSFFLLLVGVHTKIAPLVWGKMTTFLQLIFILWIFVCYFAGWNPARTYSVLLILLALFSIVSLIQYGRIGWQDFKNRKL
jgi:cardiolipin synthase